MRHSRRSSRKINVRNYHLNSDWTQNQINQANREFKQHRKVESYIEKLKKEGLTNKQIEKKVKPEYYLFI